MKKLFMTFLLALFITGCAYSTANNSWTDNMIFKNRNAVNYVLFKSNLPKKSIIIVTTFTKIDNLNETSKLGKILTQNTISSLVNQNLQVVELHLRKNNIIKMNRNGTFILSNDTKKVIDNRKANAILVGNYSIISNKEVYVNIKLINPTTGIIISSIDYTTALY